jgi:hypothetical protein
MSDSYREALEQLEIGPAVKMGELLAAEGREVTTSTGVYTIWLDSQLLYVGLSWRRPSDTTNKNAKGVFGRLKVYYDGGKNTDFMRALRRHIVVPSLTGEHMSTVGRGERDLAERTRLFAHDRLALRTWACSAEDAREIRRIVKQGSLTSSGPPVLNARRRPRAARGVAIRSE